MASYYGQVPLRFLKYRDENIALSEFSIIIAQDKFESGNVFEHVSNDLSARSIVE